MGSVALRHGNGNLLGGHADLAELVQRLVEEHLVFALNGPLSDQVDLPLGGLFDKEAVVVDYFVEGSRRVQRHDENDGIIAIRPTFLYCNCNKKS